MLSFYFKLNGRISRKALWLAVVLPFLVISYSAQAVDNYLLKERTVTLLDVEYSYAVFVEMIILAWPWFATTIRRFHDLNMAWWWALVFVPTYFWFPDVLNQAAYPVGVLAVWGLFLFASAILGLVQLFVGGTKGDNKYGLDPREAKA